MSWLIGATCGGAKSARLGPPRVARRFGAGAPALFAEPDLRLEPRFLRGAMTCAPLQ
jgi:hypothetical protein